MSGGLDQINASVQAWMRGEAPAPAIVHSDASPLWSRHYSHETDATDCATLDEVLALAGAVRMVVAHTVQNRINAACDDKVWRVDVGLAAYCGGAPAVLEITEAAVRVLE